MFSVDKLAATKNEVVLAFDPGAERCGWCVLTRDGKRFKSSIAHKGSGYFGVAREPNSSNTKTDFQPYRLSLLDFWITKAQELIESYEPTEIVSEIIPAVGGGNFVVATQSHLALCAITTIQVVAMQHGLPVRQVGATSVKKAIGGNGEATKVQVRNGVFKILPEVEDRKKEWTKVFDVSDALAIGLTHMGYKNDRTEGRKERKKKKELNGQ
jgi:Holliday junction resolvasome RuvABC endonuclease subunit